MEKGINFKDPAASKFDILSDSKLPLTLFDDKEFDSKIVFLSNHDGDADVQDQEKDAIVTPEQWFTDYEGSINDGPRLPLWALG